MSTFVNVIYESDRGENVTIELLPCRSIDSGCFHRYTSSCCNSV